MAASSRDGHRRGERHRRPAAPACPDTALLGLLGLTLLACALYFPGLGQPPLKAAEMVRSGISGLGSLAAGLPADASGWAAHLSARIFGAGLFAVRFPAALAAVATVLLSAQVGARLHSPRAGLLGGLVLATSAGFFLAGRTAGGQWPGALVALAQLLFLRAWLAESGAGSGRHLAPAASAALCLAALGLPGLALAVIPAVVVLASWSRRRPRPWKEFGRVAARFLPLRTGLLLFGAALWWLGAATGGGSSVASLPAGGIRGALSAALWLAPWAFFAPAAALDFWASRRGFLGRSSPLPPSRLESARLLLPAWLGCALALAFLGAQPIETGLAALPPAALLLGACGARGWEDGCCCRAYAATLAVLALLSGLLPLSGWADAVAAGMLGSLGLPEQGLDPGLLAAGGAMLAAGWLTGLALYVRRGVAASLLAVAVVALCLLVCLHQASLQAA